MIALDVNVVVAALREDAEDHGRIRRWLAGVVEAAEPVGISEAVLTGAVRVVSHPGIFVPASEVGDVLDLITALVSDPGVVVLSPGPGYLDILDRLCRATGVRGNDVADAGHAATAIAHGATFVTRDRGFARFPGLRWRHPV